jgi:hypothetical protein
MSIAFWRLVERGQLVFDLSARIKLNDIPSPQVDPPSGAVRS